MRSVYAHMPCTGDRKVTQSSYNIFSEKRFKQTISKLRLKFFPKQENVWNKAHTVSPIPHLSLSSARRGSSFHKLEKPEGHQKGQVLKTLATGSALQIHSYY